MDIFQGFRGHLIQIQKNAEFLGSLNQILNHLRFAGFSSTFRYPESVRQEDDIKRCLIMIIN